MSSLHLKDIAMYKFLYVEVHVRAIVLRPSKQSSNILLKDITISTNMEDALSVVSKSQELTLMVIR